jgi:hypothetical protein
VGIFPPWDDPPFPSKKWTRPIPTALFRQQKKRFIFKFAAKNMPDRLFYRPFLVFPSIRLSSAVSRPTHFSQPSPEKSANTHAPRNEGTSYRFKILR